MPKTAMIDCPECGFMVKSHDGKETLNMGMLHVSNCHADMDISTGDMKKKMKTA